MLHSMRVEIQKVYEAELDEMWSFVGTKKAPRWLWHAIDHHTGTVLAYVFGRRTDEVFLALQLTLLIILLRKRIRGLLKNGL